MDEFTKLGWRIGLGVAVILILGMTCGCEPEKIEAMPTTAPANPNYLKSPGKIVALQRNHLTESLVAWEAERNKLGHEYTEWFERRLNAHVVLQQITRAGATEEEVAAMARTCDMLDGQLKELDSRSFELRTRLATILLIMYDWESQWPGWWLWPERRREKK